MQEKNRPDIGSLLRQRVSRRGLIVGGARCSVAGSVAAAIPLRAIASHPRLARIEPGSADAVTVPRGYKYRVVLRWGDALFPDQPSLDPKSVARGALMQPGAADRQARQFGNNCDGMGVFELGNDRFLLCVNHETPSPTLMFPGWAEARLTRSRGPFVQQYPESVACMQASVGLSVVEVDRERGWRPVLGSPFNRRITASTPFEFAGPAMRHELLGATDAGPARGLGTLGNCAAGTTPWGTYLTAEENVDDYFGNGDAADFSPQARRAHTRFGFRRRDSGYRWEYVESRFDLARQPNELLKFGWVVEVDPHDPRRPPRKRTALGRFKHEGATTTLSTDGRVAVYMGDDQVFEYFYKFVSRDRFVPGDRDANRDLLDSGTLFVARLGADGRGEWLPLVWSTDGPLSPATGFASQADVVLHCREAADIAGATPLDRPEDVAVDERSRRVYLSCTANPQRGTGRRGAGGREVENRVDAPNPREHNRFGHILEFSEADGDAAATAFRWEVLILAGKPTAPGLRTDAALQGGGPLPAGTTYFAGYADLTGISAFANPDNLACDGRGNLWIVTDGSQPLGNNNGCFICPTEGEYRGAVAQFMSGPVGAEISGCEITADEKTLFLTVQHPGSGGTATAPVSDWPDGERAAPRSSLIAIEARDRTRKVGDA